jgi:nitrile hydratase beta subunit
MNGPHDMGGFTGFGPVVAESNEPVFHAEWERRTYAMAIAVGGMGIWSLDHTRQQRERIPATAYWSSTYYEIWLAALQQLLLQHGLVTAVELADGVMREPASPLGEVLRPGRLRAILARGTPASRPLDRKARFRPGDKIRTRTMSPAGHSRLPRYAMGHAGAIVAIRGAHVFPDSLAQDLGEDPQWLYSVRFSTHELWGKTTNDVIHLDLWEPYLDAR